MKKILALVLAVMLVVGMTPVSFAAKITSEVKLTVASDATLGLSGAVDINTSTRYAKDVNPTDPTLKTKFYLWDPSDTTKPVTRSMVSDSKITLQKQTSTGGKAIKSIDLKYEGSSGSATGLPNQAYVQVEFADTYVGTGDLDFKYSFYFLYDKNRLGTDNKYEFEGVMKNRSQEVYADTDFLYTYDNPVMDVKEYVKSVKIDTGNDLVINAKLFAGKKYYARTTVKVKSEDDEILTQYPDIDTIYYLDTVNMSGSGNTVKIDIGDKLYVYNKDLEYVGTTADNLPFSTKYYVSSKELDIEDVNDIDDPTGPAEAPNPNMGGDDVVRNVNDNPGTGR